MHMYRRTFSNQYKITSQTSLPQIWKEQENPIKWKTQSQQKEIEDREYSHLKMIVRLEGSYLRTFNI